MVKSEKVSKKYSADKTPPAAHETFKEKLINS